MSKTSESPETTPKTSKFAEKINSMKPAALSDEKRAAVVGRIKIIGAFTAGVLTTAAIAVTASYYKSINENLDVEDVEETEETTD